MRIAIISANFGSFDKDYRKDNVPQLVPEGWVIDYHYFDDNNYPYRKLSLSDRLRGKLPKILGYEIVGDYDFYVWIDSNITFNNPLTINILIQHLINGNGNILLFNHPHRNTLRQEFKFMNELMDNDPYIIKRYEGELIKDQEELYKSVLDDKLYIGGIFIYSKEIIELGILKEWFYQCCRYSVQDQLSLPYILNNADVSIVSLNWNFGDNTYLKYHWSHS